MATPKSIPPAASTSKKTPSAATLKHRHLKLLICSAEHEDSLARLGFQFIAGVDEVGRGALFGPVVAAAVILPADQTLLAEIAAAGLKDSKQLTEAKREQLDQTIRLCARSVALGEVDSATIDTINIYQATRLAMHRAVESLSPPPDHLLIDAMRLDHPCPQTSLTYGDALSLSIAAASVIAKVYRDRLIRSLDCDYPSYGLARHKGYGTALHLAALRLHGSTPLHRQSFAPVAEAHRQQAARESKPAPDHPTTQPVRSKEPALA